MDDFVLDAIGNKVHVGDEIIHIEYAKAFQIKNNIKKVESLKNDCVQCRNRCGILCTIYRFIKVIREEE